MLKLTFYSQFKAKVDPASIWQNYRPLKKPEPEPEKLDSKFAGPYMEQLTMVFAGIVVLCRLSTELLHMLVEKLS